MMSFSWSEEDDITDRRTVGEYEAPLGRYRTFSASTSIAAIS